MNYFMARQSIKCAIPVPCELIKSKRSGGMFSPPHSDHVWFTKSRSIAGASHFQGSRIWFLGLLSLYLWKSNTRIKIWALARTWMWSREIKESCVCCLGSNPSGKDAGRNWWFQRIYETWKELIEGVCEWEMDQLDHRFAWNQSTILSDDWLRAIIC